MIFNVQISTPELLPQKYLLPPSFISGLKQGQILNAKVISAGPGNKAQLMVSGQNISAKTDLPLIPGTTLSLQVNRGDNGTISLRLTPDALLTQSGMNTGSPAGPVLGKILQGIDQVLPQLGKTNHPALKAILQNLALSSGTADKDFLPNLMQNVGVSMENKIADFLGSPIRKDFRSFWQTMEKQDLKAAVLSILQTGGDEGESTLMKGVSNTLESFQQLNQQSQQSADTHRFVLPFPVLTDAQFDFGHLLIDTGKEGKGGDENRVIKIAFLMSLSALGDIRADFSILNKAITGRFLLEDRETRDYLASLMPELTERLASIDYKAAGIECRVGTPKVFSPDTLVQSIADAEASSGFNLVI